MRSLSFKLKGAKYFSKLDAKSGYWQIKLEQNSSVLTTFNTQYGRYRFLHMPFGIHSAQEVFQKKVDETYEGLKGVAAIVDDDLVYGATVKEHDDNLRAVLQRSREKGVKLNPDKCTIRVTEVSYFGNLLTVGGLKPDPGKVAAINEMPPSTYVEELQTILGMVNYLANFPLVYLKFLHRCETC